MFAGIFTGIVAATVAMSRLLYPLAASDVLPRAGWFGRLDSNGSPEMKDSYTQSGFDGILIKPANLESLRRLFQ